MPFSSTTIRDRRRSELRQKLGDAPCALLLTADCQAVGGEIDYEARSPHPRSFEVDHVTSSEEAALLGWSPVDTDALDNCQPACRQCNRAKSSGLVAAGRLSYVNPRFL